MTDAPAEAGTDADPGSAVETGERSDAESAAGDGSTYSGLFSAFPYAFRASESRLFRAYAVLGGLAALLVVLVFAAALVNLMGETAGVRGGTFTFSRAFFVVLMVLVFAPLVAPVLLVARRHRREGSDRRYDRALAAAGYLFLCSVYAALGVSVPPALQADSPGAVGAFLYSLPTEAAVVPPVIAVLALSLAHRYYR
ncbi:hypothetical protein BRD11_00425 [Halobacteriales archaeon SW_12_69_24]|nr:MAG: hypothetical protein BRD11_00425 [Halobacteriales archaeon SW_12_69_24]